MKCPYCGSEMEQGYIQGGREVFWSRKKSKFFREPDEIDRDIEIAPIKYFSFSVNENSYLCRSCGKVIIDICMDDKDC